MKNAMRIPMSDEVVLGAHVVGGTMAGLAAMVATRPQATAAGWVEIFLIAPRMILHASGHLRVARKLASVKAADCEMIVAKLLRHGSALPIGELVRPNEKLQDLTPRLAWLAFYDWIGVGEKGDRVWLHTQSRELLLAK